MRRKGQGKGRLLVWVVLGFAAWSGAAFASSGVPLPPRKAGAIPVSTAPLPEAKPVLEDGLSATEEAIIRFAKTRSTENGASDKPPVPVVPYRKPVSEVKSITHGPGAWKEPKPPRRKPMPVGNVPLSAEDSDLYRRIFAAQAVGDMDKADELIEQLGDFRLRGHVLFQRYMHPTAYTSTFEELQNWLGLYADYPDADKIYRLAVSKKPAHMEGELRQPKVVRGISGFLESSDERSQPYKSSRKRNADERRKVSTIFRDVRRHVDRGGPTDAWKTLNEPVNKAALDQTEFDILRSYVAYGYLHSNKIDKAYELASASVSRSGVRTPLGAWISGLIAWRRGEYGRSASYFEVTALSPHATGWMISGAAYWASRAHMRTGNVRAVSYWLQKAASYPRTFYGLIATRALGQKFEFNWDIPRYTDAHEKRLMKSAAARRAMALLQAGQFHLAENEMRRIDPGDGEVKEALLAYAAHEGLPAFAMRLANAIPHPQGGLYDAALYPLAPWQPKDGFKVDLALVHAIIRQESRFDPSAENRSGATGLMQLMPATAGYVAGSRRFRGDGRHHLKDPMTNIDLGQRYIHALLGQDVVDRDLFSLTIAYNAGPGNLAKWKRRLGGIQDPLLFVESIPVAETRAYVERVLANYWIYRLRLGQPTPTLDAVASGKWARYVRLDDGPTMLADMR